MDTTDGKKMLGERLAYYMHKAELSVPALEARVGNKPRRSYIYKILEGTANVSIKVYEKLLKACNNVTLAECLLSLRDDSKIPNDCSDLYEKLDEIVEAKQLGTAFERLVEGIRVNLEAISLNVRIIKDRAGPNPNPGGGQEALKNRDGKTGNTTKTRKRLKEASAPAETGQESPAERKFRL